MRTVRLLQDSILFSGSLRYNLDPFGERPDEQLVKVLEHCALGPFLAEHEDGLRRPIDERGSNLSLGQVGCDKLEP